jgi:hypothetical protein
MTGCSTLAHFVKTNMILAPADDAFIDITADHQPGGFQVYDSNPYTIHLEIEEPDSTSESEPLYGDGGASLNAYAACLTLKVIF